MTCSEHSIYLDSFTEEWFTYDFLNPCYLCVYQIDDVFDFFLGFDEIGVDFNIIPYDCPLPDFRYDGELIEWL